MAAQEEPRVGGAGQGGGHASTSGGRASTRGRQASTGGQDADQTAAAESGAGAAAESGASAAAKSGAGAAAGSGAGAAAGSGAGSPAGTDRTGLQVIPAIDLLGDEAVRLEQGRFDRVSVRAGRPEDLVARYAAAGPALIHVVDLEGARSGRIRPEIVRSLVRAAGSVPVQASGGIRSVADALALLDAGAARVVVGTAAFAGPDALERFASALGERLVVAVDTRSGRVAVAGWERESGLRVEDACAACAAAGVPRLLCTAIDRDGTMGGPDLELLALVRERSGLPVLAAGGIRTVADLDALAAAGLEGAIVGRALIEGSIPLSALSGGHRA